jgi:hypothetical protein
MTMSNVRGAVSECQECGVPLHPADVHEPHDRDCTRSVMLHVGADACDCDNTTCPACCWSCNPVAVEHRYNGDSDACSCGGEVVWFADGDDLGDVSEGCEVAGLTWRSLALRRLG